MSEHQVQVALTDFLARARNPNVSYFAVPNGGFRSKVTAARLKAEGARSGAPDLMVFVGGRTFGIELKKAQGGTVSPNQRAMHSELQAAGVICIVARGVHEGVAALVKIGAVPAPRHAAS